MISKAFRDRVSYMPHFSGAVHSEGCELLLPDSDLKLDPG